MKLKAGFIVVVWAQGSGAMNGDDLEAYWREVVDICPCAMSGSLLMEIGTEKHAAIPKGWSHHPTKSEKK